MSKNIITKTTIESLATELKKKFAATETRLTAAEAQSALAFKSGKVTGNTVAFYTSADKSGTPAFSLDFPVEAFLDQNKTRFEDSFAWSEAAYPGSANPNMDGKPVFVLAVKGKTTADSVSYSFVNMAALVDTYKARTEGKDASTTVTVNGYEIDAAVNLSAEAGNALVKKDDGLYVSSPRVAGAAAGNLAGLAADGSLTDSGIASSKVISADDITDYTAEEIAALLADTPA